MDGAGGREAIGEGEGEGDIDVIKDVTSKITFYIIAY